MAAGVTGSSVCQKILKSRSWLTGLERGYTKATRDDLARVDAAIDDIVRARQYLTNVAAKASVSLIGVMASADTLVSTSKVVDEPSVTRRKVCRNAQGGE